VRKQELMKTPQDPAPKTPANVETSHDASVRGVREDAAKSARAMQRTALDFSYVGIHFGVATAIGYFIGRALDNTWGTTPWLAIGLALLGTASGFMELARIVKRAKRREMS